MNCVRYHIHDATVLITLEVYMFRVHTFCHIRSNYIFQLTIRVGIPLNSTDTILKRLSMDFLDIPLIYVMPSLFIIIAWEFLFVLCPPELRIAHLKNRIKIWLHTKHERWKKYLSSALAFYLYWKSCEHEIFIQRAINNNRKRKVIENLWVIIDNDIHIDMHE